MRFTFKSNRKVLKSLNNLQHVNTHLWLIQPHVLARSQIGSKLNCCPRGVKSLLINPATWAHTPREKKKLQRTPPPERGTVTQQSRGSYDERALLFVFYFVGGGARPWAQPNTTPHLEMVGKVRQCDVCAKLKLTVDWHFLMFFISFFFFFNDPINYYFQRREFKQFF